MAKKKKCCKKPDWVVLQTFGIPQEHRRRDLDVFLCACVNCGKVRTETCIFKYNNKKEN